MLVALRALHGPQHRVLMFNLNVNIKAATVDNLGRNERKDGDQTQGSSTDKHVVQRCY